MKAYKGVVKNGKIELCEGTHLPEGTVVTVSVGEAELIRASLAAALRRGNRKQVSPVPAYRTRMSRSA